VRFLAVDLGDKRTGLALGDDETRLVTPVGVVEVAISVRGGEALLETLARSVKEQLGERKSPGELVVGLPLNMDGTEGPRARIVREFGARLAAACGRAVHFYDERLTSADAEWSLARSGLTHGRKKQKRDALAAAAILRDFLESRKNPGEPGV
jgi:putative Holliday junction resolvase